MPNVTFTDYVLLAAFRYEIRKFLAFSARAARTAGVEPQQHQLLLAVKGFPKSSRPTIGDIAERLCIEHHTTVELVDKLEARGFVVRTRSTEDRRRVLLHLTPKGTSLLRKLSVLHREQLARVGPHMVEALGAILTARGADSGGGIVAGGLDPPAPTL
ncbi:MAG TPA: MarR family transcriptional regulator [Polyangiaceae bacterium]